MAIKLFELDHVKHGLSDNLMLLKKHIALWNQFLNLLWFDVWCQTACIVEMNSVLQNMIWNRPIEKIHLRLVKPASSFKTLFSPVYRSFRNV